MQVSASVSVPNLSSQEASKLMDSFVRSISRAPAVENVNLSQSEEDTSGFGRETDLSGGQFVSSYFYPTYGNML